MKTKQSETVIIPQTGVTRTGLLFPAMASGPIFRGPFFPGLNWGPLLLGLLGPLCERPQPRQLFQGIHGILKATCSDQDLQCIGRVHLARLGRPFVDATDASCQPPGSFLHCHLPAAAAKAAQCHPRRCRPRRTMSMAPQTTPLAQDITK